MSDELEPFRKAAELGCPDFRAWPDGRVTFRCLSFHDLPRPDRNFEHHVRINRYAAAVCMAFWVESKESGAPTYFHQARAFGKKHGASQ